MKVAVFSSITSSYIPNARILCSSVKMHHPEWDFYLLFNDHTPEDVRWENELFDNVVFAEWLETKRPWLKLSHNYSVVEFCTATKGTMAKHLLQNLGYDAVVYLDPDTRVFSPLIEIMDIFNNGKDEVILTPHLTDPEEDDEGIWSHEIAALKHGVYNLGFFAIKGGSLGLKFLDWWERRLLDYSHIDFNYGTFTDQKWANLCPYLFEGIHVLCDRCYNVATWNIKGRNLSKNDRNEWTINGSLLRFYHFSGFGFDFGWANRELELFAKQNHALKDIWDEYKELYRLNRLNCAPKDWEWSSYRSGIKIVYDNRRDPKSVSVVDPYEFIL